MRRLTSTDYSDLADALRYLTAGFDDETTEEIELDSINELPPDDTGVWLTPDPSNAVHGGDVLATSYYDHLPIGKKIQPAAIPETIREERKLAGKCLKCGELLPMSIYGLQPCVKCKC